MPSRIAWADLAVVSGGSTVWELARLGCPALVIETVPAEVRLAAGLANVGLFGRLGKATALDDERLAGDIAAKLDDAPWRARMSQLGPKLVDGKGARRVARAIAGDNGGDDDRERD
jgi:spore coat polysaccharide biosynthesis predicted glycosyltransferase SpsG